MIIKGNSRRSISFWVRHLLNTTENDRAEVVAKRGLMADDLRGMMREMEQDASVSARCKNFMHIASFNPQAHEHLTDEQWQQAYEIYEKHRGIPPDMQRIEVEHEKKGRVHRHVIWQRVNTETGLAFADGLNFRVCEAAQKEIEETLGLEKTPHLLNREPGTPRPKPGPKSWEKMRGQRSGIDPAQVTAEITDIYRQSENGADFVNGLHQHGYLFVEGDRAFCILDAAGDVHNLVKRIDGAKTKELKAFMRGVDLSALPSVEQARVIQQERRIENLEADRATVRDDIQWEQALNRAGIEHEERARRFAEPEGETRAGAAAARDTAAREQEPPRKTDIPVLAAIRDAEQQRTQEPDSFEDFAEFIPAQPSPEFTPFLAEITELDSRIRAALLDKAIREPRSDDFDALLARTPQEVREFVADVYQAQDYNRAGGEWATRALSEIQRRIAVHREHGLLNVSSLDAALLNYAIRQPGQIPELEKAALVLGSPDLMFRLGDHITAVRNAQALNLKLTDIAALSDQRGALMDELSQRYIDYDNDPHAYVDPGFWLPYPELQDEVHARLYAYWDQRFGNEQHDILEPEETLAPEETRGGAMEHESRPPAPAAPELGKTQGEIRLARTLSHGPQSFVEALRERDLLLSRVTPEDVAREMARLRGEWEEQRLNPQSWMEHEGGFHVLNPDLQQSARRSFDAWKERREQKQQQDKSTFTPSEPTAEELQKELEGYVEYVQGQWAQGPRSRLQNAKGGLAVVTRYGSAFVLTERNTALEEAELRLYLKRIDREALPTVAEAEAEQRLRMAEKAARRDQPLNKTAAQIRLAYALTQGPGDFTQALNRHGLRPARVTAEEIHAGQASDKARAGDVVILDRWGNTYELNQRTTGDSRENAQAFLAGIDANLSSVTAIRREQQEQQQDRQQQPFRDEPALSATTGNIRLAYALTQGPGDFTQALKEHGLQPARVTAQEIQEGEVSEKARAGDVVILDRRGNIYELNQRTTGDSRENAQAFLAGIDVNLPSVAAIRREQELQAERPLNKVAANIRLAYNLSHSAQGFVQNLDELGLKLARASHDEAERSRTASAFSREIGRFAPEYYDGQYVVVTERGHAYALNQHTTGQHRAAIERFMATLDPSSFHDIETMQRQARNERHWPIMGQPPEKHTSATGLKIQDAPATSPALHFQDAARQTQKPEAAPAIPADLRGIAAEIWTAYNTRQVDREWQRTNTDGTKETQRDRITLKGGRDPLKFGLKLDERGLILARATKEEAEQSQKEAEHWKKRGQYHPAYREGEFVVIDRRGEVWKLTERTTGHSAKEVQAFLNKADWKALPGIEAGQQTMKARIDQRLADARDRAAIWDAIRLKNATRKHGGRGNGRVAAASDLARPLGITARVSGRAIGAFGALGKLADGFSLDALTPKEKYEAAKRDARNEREADKNADYAAYTAELAERWRRDQQRQAEQRQNEPEPHPQRQR